MAASPYSLMDTLSQGGYDMVLIGIALWVLLSFAVAPVAGKLIAIGMDNEDNGGGQFVS